MTEPIKLPRVQTEYFVPAGGLDIVTPPYLLKTGAAISASNVEVDLEAGYSRIAGYDRYINGRTMVEQDFKLATITGSDTDTVFSGRVLVGVVSGARLTFVARFGLPPNTGGIIPNGQHVCYVSEVEGVFIAGEHLVAAVGDQAFSGTITMDVVPAALPGVTLDERVASRAAADLTARAQMQAISNALSAIAPTGSVLGLSVLDDLPVVVMKASTQNVCLFITPVVQGPLTNTPDNRFWVTRVTSTIPAVGAKFEFAVSELGSAAVLGTTANRLFGVSGTSKAFIYYEGTLINITTGMAVDTPEHIALHANRVFLSFGASLQYSQAGDPMSWTPVLGAGEINTGSPITGLLSLTGQSNETALLVSTEERLFVLYGDSDANFQLVPFATDSGALPGTLQWMGQAIFQNAFGLTKMAATQSYGGFENSTFTGPIKPLLDARRGKATCSMIVRNKNQYRVFFDDGSGIYVNFRPDKRGYLASAGMFPVQFAHKVTCCWSFISKGKQGIPKGEEVLLVGTADGEIFRLDVGWAFNGLPIPWSLRLAFNHLKSPRVIKRFFRTTVEIQAAGYTKIAMGYDLDYRGAERAITPLQSVQTDQAPETQYWADALWNQFRWDSTSIEPITIDTPGSGVSFSLRMQGNDASTQPFTLSGLILSYIARRLKH